MIGKLVPPFSAIFLIGMLWRKVGGKDVFIAVIFGFALAGILKYLELGLLKDSMTAFAIFIKPFANQGLVVLAFTLIVTTISAF